jgi:hypothetical protein
MSITTTRHVRTGLCQDERSLTQAWNTAIREYSRAVDAFTTALRNYPTECDSLRAEVERAHLASNNARLSLAMHRNEHGCHKPVDGYATTAAMA